MHNKNPIILMRLVSISLLLPLLLLGCNGPSSTADCTADIPVGAGLFTSPPTDIANITNVIPLGNLNPGGGHVLSVDHMYLSYPVPAGGGASSYPIHTMADGKLMIIIRQQVPDRPDYDYQAIIRHSCSVYSYYDHLHELSTVISDYLVNNSVPWLDISGSGAGPWLSFLGQSGGTPMLPVVSGQQIGITKNYSYNWDVGVVDTRQTNGIFVNPNAKRYPSLTDLTSLFPILSGIDMSIYQLGNKMLSAACFIDYMDNSSGMQTAWRNKLASIPIGCGTVGWDVPNHLRGAWFNPALDAAPTVTFDHETAALSIIPSNYTPGTQIQIGFGNAANGTTVPSLALIDPETWTPSITALQIKNPFLITIGTTPGVVVNPDPAAVGTGVTVCYDLTHTGGNGTLLLHMTDASHLKVKYDPGSDVSPQCANLAPVFPAVGPTWIGYVR